MALRPVPLAGFIGSGILGVAGGAAIKVGGVQLKRAATQIRDDSARYDVRHEKHLAQVRMTNATLRAYGGTQERAHQEVVLRMKAFLERNGPQVRLRDYLTV